MHKRISASVEVKAPVAEVFDYWSDFKNFPYFLQDVQRVEKVGKRTSRWTVKKPVGGSMDLEVMVTDVQPNRLLAWESAGASVPASGEVRFDATANRLTRIELTMDYPVSPKDGTANFLVSSPEEKIAEDLENFTRIVTGGGLSLDAHLTKSG